MEEASTAEAAAFIVAASSIAAATEAVVVVTAVAAALIPSTVDCRASARSTGGSEHIFDGFRLVGAPRPMWASLREA
jgi:hypothetical protein